MKNWTVYRVINEIKRSWVNTERLNTIMEKYEQIPMTQIEEIMCLAESIDFSELLCEYDGYNIIKRYAELRGYTETVDFLTMAYRMFDYTQDIITLLKSGI